MDIGLAAAAVVWGCTWGAVTSIPLGPTGALVMARASRDDRKGIYFVTAGFALAHIVYQLVYHWSLGRVMIAESLHHGVLRSLAMAGVFILGLAGVRDAGRSLRTLSSRHAASNRPTEAETRDIGADVPEPMPYAVASLRNPGAAVLAQSFFLAILNPALLLFLCSNAALFSSQFPERVGFAHIVLLFAATLVGTSAWYIGFGEWLRKRSATWTVRHRAWADGLSGVILLTASLSLGWKILAG